MNDFLKKIKNLSGDFFQRRVSVADKMFFAKHLSIMIHAGMPILDSLWLLKKQTRSKSFQKILDTLIVDIDNGQFLSVSLEKYRSALGGFFINVIRIGEASGTLVKNLNYLHDELKKSYELRRKIKAAMMYPMIILIASFVIGGLLLFYIFPKILPVFAGFKIQLPLITRALIAFINFFMKNWLFVGAGVFLAGFSLWLLLKVKSVKFFYHGLLLSLPFIGKVVVNVNIASFSRTFVTLLKSGVKIVDAVLITADTLPNLVYQEKLRLLAESVKTGESMASYFLRESRFFPKIFSQMVEVGENTGHLDENLSYLSEFYEAEVDEVFKNISTILEPVLLLLMGVFVGFIVLAVITPIYSFTQNLKIR